MVIFSMPDPLHPAVVHFPIVLLLMGAGVAVASAFVNRWNLVWISAALLIMGAAGAFVAGETGEDSREALGKLVGNINQLVEDHQEWAEQTEIAAAITAMLAVMAAVGNTSAHPTARKRKPFAWLCRPRIHYTLRSFTAAAALLLCFFVYQTARLGGELVYDHGVGVNVAEP
jgi:uncharacterized membrane protein